MLLALSAEETLALAQELWGSVEEDFDTASDEEVCFAMESLKMHEENPSEGFTIEQFKKYFGNKYGF